MTSPDDLVLVPRSVLLPVMGEWTAAIGDDHLLYVRAGAMRAVKHAVDSAPPAPPLAEDVQRAQLILNNAQGYFRGDDVWDVPIGEALDTIRRALAVCGAGTTPASEPTGQEARRPAGEHDDDWPARAVIDGDVISIRVPIDALPMAFSASPLTPLNEEKVEPRWRVADEREFAKSLCYRLNEETETGETAIHRMLDAAMEQVLEQGDEGLEEVGPNDPKGGDGDRPNRPGTAQDTTIPGRTDADPPAGENPTSEEIIVSAYQVIGSLADEFGVFDHPEVIRALDYFAYDDRRGEELLPWPRTPLRQPTAGDTARAELVARLREVRDHDWRLSFLAHTSDTAAEAADQIERDGRPEVRCDGCGSRWTDADLAAARAANPTILACCPERKPLTIDQWRERAEKAEAALADVIEQCAKVAETYGADRPLLTAQVAYRAKIAAAIRAIAPSQQAGGGDG